VLAETVAEVQAVLAWCARHEVPVVARGAGTGLSGGALPHPEGVLLSLARFQRILELDPANRVARVEPGVRNLQVSEAAAPYGLYYAPDPSSQIACTIGGNVAENSGGVHCLKYGLTVHNVTGLKWLSYEGELMTAGGAVLASPGYDLLALLHGSEGMLGVLVEATLRLLPRPECRQVLLAAFADVAEAAEAVSAVIARGIVPAGLEMMDRLAVKAAEQFAHAGYPLDAAAILICEVDGTEAEVAAQADAVARLFEDGGATSVRRAATEQECDRLWRGRKSAFPAVGRIAPDYYCMDGTIPRRALAQVLGEIERMASEYGLEVANVFHAGDGNLHPLILYDANDEAQLERAEQLGTEILKLCVRVGGTVTGEHGVGVEKLDPMCSQFAAPELARFHALKAAFDPAGILNPGKAVPTLARCAELGGMHVHAGQVPFPELPRF
jgi:glycolate oxidase